MNKKVFQYSCEFANHADGASRFIYDVANGLGVNKHLFADFVDCNFAKWKLDVECNPFIPHYKKEQVIHNKEIQLMLFRSLAGF